MSSEYIFEINDALYDRESGKVCMKPKVVGELIRCGDCKYSSDNGVYGCRVESFNYDINTRMYSDGFCSKAERRTDG